MGRRRRFKRSRVSIDEVRIYSNYPKIKVSGDENIINVGDVYNVKILDVDDEGRGLAKVKGHIIRVVGATLGDEVTVKIIKVSKSGITGIILG